VSSSLDSQGQPISHDKLDSQRNVFGDFDEGGDLWVPEGILAMAAAWV
jgi:hypothetical protein